MNILNTIKEIFSEDNGNISTMRILIFFIITVVLFNWTWINIATGTLVGFDWADLGLIIGPLFAKSYQKGKEE